MRPIFFLITYLMIAAFGFGQVPENSELFRQLKIADSLVFEEGFNHCNLEILKEIMHPDLQFIHDQNGMQDREAFFQGFEESICSNPDFKPIRKLVKGSLQVYPLKNEGKVYGAIQTGIHEFFIAEPGKELRFTVNGKFIHIWILDQDKWKLFRAISYDHQQPKRYPDPFEDHFPFPLFHDDSTIESLIKALNIPSISIGYIHNGKLQQIRAFGQQKPGVPIAYNSIYKVASLTKPITALTVLKLVDQGEWDLDEPLASYYVDPELINAPYLPKLTTRNVLSQQSGLPNWRYLRPDKKLVFEFEPGTKFQYSGEGFEYLRKALEHKFSRSLDDIARQELFQPLGMHDTHFFWSDQVDENRYAVESDPDGHPLPFEKYDAPNAAANLLTTVEDYAKFLVCILDGGGLSPQLFALFSSPISTVKDGINWGLGMQVFPNLPGDEYALVHTGGDNGTKCIAMVLPRSRQGLVLFINSENGLKIWKKIIEEYFGETGAEIVRRNLEG
ncbi:MAG: class A beta-lactamase-related serine hydrolase [Saprospiraceae bacterium]|nr:class A beta-lactamase-related serine hydrolase [Saprospiraceae bacterium]